MFGKKTKKDFSAASATDTPDPRQKIIYTISEKLENLEVSNLKLIKPDDNIASLEASPVMINNINLTIQPGMRVALTGGSGTGKSTFLGVIGNEWPWGQGDVRVPAHWHVLSLPQAPYIASLPFRDVLTYPNTSGNQYSDTELADALQKVGLGDKIKHLDPKSAVNGDRLHFSMSGGEKQRLRVAMLLLQKPFPDLITLDEITASLDETLSSEIYKLLMEVIPAKTAIVSVIHKTDLIQYHTHHAEIKNGALTMRPVGEAGKRPCADPCRHCSLNPR